MVTASQQTEEFQPPPRRPQPASGLSAQMHADAQSFASLAIRLFRWRAALWWLTATLATTLLLILADNMIHAEEAGLRWLISLSWFIIVATTAWRLLEPAWSFSLTPVRAAQWIEHLRPELNGRLSNALAIAELPEHDTRFGSRAFREAALLGSMDPAEDIHWRSYLDYRPTQRAAVCAVALCLVGSGLSAAFPSLAQRGLQRLFSPWLAAPWPHADELRFVNLPAMIASGSELHIEVIDDRPPLPARVEVEIREIAADATSTNGNNVRFLSMRVLQDVAIAAVSDVRTSLAVRPRGGDDQNAAWHEVHVAEVPELLEHQFHVVPPAYSRQEATDLVGQRIEVLSGSRITFHGRSSRPLRSVAAVAVHEGRERPQIPLGTPTAQMPFETTSTNLASTDATGSSATASERRTSTQSAVTVRTSAAVVAQTESSQQWTAKLSSDRLAFDLFTESGGMLIDADRRWQLVIETEEGLQVRDPRTWSIHAVADRPPSINLLPIEPPGMTREALVNLLGEASDDLELVEVKLVWQAGDGNQPHSRTLWPEQLVPATSPTVRAAESTADTSHPRQQQRAARIRSQWHPAEENLPDGQPISVALEARDSAGQLTRSVTQSLQIQDSQTVLAQIQANEAQTFEPLRQLLDAQRRTLHSVNRTRDIVRESRTVEAAQLDAISGARQSQQSITQQLSQSQNSVLNKLQSLSEQLVRNGLENSDGAKHIAGLTSEIQRLNLEAILPAVKELEEAQRSMRTATDRAAPQTSDVTALAAQLDKTAERQQQAVDQFNHLVESIASAETTAELRNDFIELLARQNEVRGQTERLQVDRVLHPESRSGQAQQVGLRSDQRSLARAVDDLAATIDELLQGTPGADPQGLKTLDLARRALIEQRVSEQMREAAELVNAGQLTAGIDAQRSAAEALAKAADNFGSTESGSLASSSASLQHTANRLAELAQAESHLADRLSETSALAAAEIPSHRDERAMLTKQQSQLADEAKELSAELRRRSDAKLSDAVEGAGQQATAAAQEAREQEFAKAAESAKQAAQRFERAHESARRRAAELKQQIADQKLLDIGSAIAELVRLQVPVVEQLNELQKRRGAEPEKPDASWETELRNAAVVQENVRLRVAATVASTQAVDPFAWVLSQCETDMTRAVAALERGRLEPDALGSAESALRKLVAANQSLSQEPPAASTDDSQAKSADQRAASADSQSNHPRPTMASLKLLRALQADIHQRSEKLQSNAAGPTSPEMLRLAEEQQSLAEQTRKVIQQLVK